MTTTHSSPIEAVLFDFSGVLAEEGYISGLTALALDHGLSPEDFVSTATDICYATGYADGLAPASAFWDGVRAFSGITLSDAALHEAILSRFTIRPEMFAEVDALREGGLTVAIVSDHTDWLEMLDARHDIFSHFDSVFTSYREKCDKRTGLLFDAAISGMGLPPERMAFFDDNAGNIQRATQRGIKARLFLDRHQYRADIAALLSATRP